MAVFSLCTAVFHRLPWPNLYHNEPFEAIEFAETANLETQDGNNGTKKKLLLKLFAGLRKNSVLHLTKSDIDCNNRKFAVVESKNRQPQTLTILDNIRATGEKALEGKQNEFAFPVGGKAGNRTETRRQIDGKSNGRAATMLCANLSVQLLSRASRVIFTGISEILSF